jgi:hypothetical protein
MAELFVGVGVLQVSLFHLANFNFRLKFRDNIWENFII